MVTRMNKETGESRRGELCSPAVFPREILVYIFFGALRGELQDPGVFQQCLEALEGGGIVNAVGDTLVAGDAVIHIALFRDAALAVRLPAAALGAKAQEAGKVAEVVDVVLHGADAQRAHVADGKGAVVRAGIQQTFGQPVMVIHEAQQPHAPAHEKTGQPDKSGGAAVKIGFAGAGEHLVNGVVDAAVDIVDGVGGAAEDLDAGHGGVGGAAPADADHNLYIVAGIDAAAGNKAVDPRAQGGGTDIGGGHQMGKAHVLAALAALLQKPALQLRHLETVAKAVAGIGAAGHGINGEALRRLQRTKLPPVLAVAQSLSVVVVGHRMILPQVSHNFLTIHYKSFPVDCKREEKAGIP